MPYSLETLTEIVERIESKIDKMNGSISSSIDRITTLERSFDRHDGEISSLRGLFAKIGAPIVVGISIALITMIWK